MAAHKTWKKRSGSSWTSKTRQKSNDGAVIVERSPETGRFVAKSTMAERVGPNGSNRSLFSKSVSRDVSLPSGGKITYLRKDVLDSALGRKGKRSEKDD